MSDEHLYVQATEELKSGNYSSSLWTKSLNLCKGDEQQAFYEYVDLRVEQLRDIDASRLKNSMTERPYIETRTRYHERPTESVRLETDRLENKRSVIQKGSLPIYAIWIAGLISVACWFYHYLNKVLSITFTQFTSIASGDLFVRMFGEMIGGALLFPLLAYGISFLFKAQQNTKRGILFYGFLLTGVIHLCMVFIL